MVFLAPGSLNHTANIIKGFAIAIGIAFAMWMVWLWWQRRQAERRQELSARTHSVYAAHLRSALQDADLTEPAPGLPADKRYRLFVAGLLATAEEILALEPTEAWRGTLRRQLAAHRSYLASEEFRASGLADCSPEVRALIENLART